MNRTAQLHRCRSLASAFTLNRTAHGHTSALTPTLRGRVDEKFSDDAPIRFECHGGRGGVHRRHGHRSVAIGIPLGSNVAAQTSPPVPVGALVVDPHSHADDDSSPLTRAQEEALGARATAEGIGVRPEVVARRSGRTATAAPAANPAVREHGRARTTGRCSAFT